MISIHQLSCSAFKHEPRPEELRWRGRVVYFLSRILVSKIADSIAEYRRSKLQRHPSGDARGNSRSGAHLSALALETTDALLSPLSSHLRTVVARLVTASPGLRTFLERRRRLTILRG